MNFSNTNSRNAVTRLLAVALMAWALAGTAQATTPGITGNPLTGSTSTYNFTAGEAWSSQPDGAQIYSWGYGCAAGSTPAYAPFPGNCPAVQIPGPTLIVTEGQVVSVTLTNNLPPGAGNTSIVFAGFQVTTTGGTPGLLAGEALPLGKVTYTFTATAPGTHAYYSGTQADLQIEMGLYGAVVVLPSAAALTAANCTPIANRGINYTLAPAAYDHPAACYDREYLFQFAEMDARIHRQAEEQVQLAKAAHTATPNAVLPPLNVATEPYHPSYFLINGRSMPDDMDANYAPNYPIQPYNGNPHMHPGDRVLLRVIGQGRWEHPFHEHGNHVRILGRDGNLILAQTSTNLAGQVLFTTDTFPGQTLDGIFYWSGKGLGWDIYGHTAANSGNPGCTPDVNGYDTSTPSAGNYYEWCADHNHPLEGNPFGQVGFGGPATTPDPLIMTNGLWYNGSPYLGQEAVTRSQGITPLPPGGALQNPPEESGIAFMWHSHNEREITTNDLFPGGMLMMMLVDPPKFAINETL